MELLYNGVGIEAYNMNGLPIQEDISGPRQTLDAKGNER